MRTAAAIVAGLAGALASWPNHHIRPMGDDAGLTFLSIGDWGGAALGGQITLNVDAVASAMATSAAAVDGGIPFIVNTGDNFYWCGIQNTTDVQVFVDYTEPYADQALQVPWLSVLGNHEYGYNSTAQLDLANILPNWVMDDRYYTRRVELDAASGTHASFIMLDSSPCVPAYRSNSSSGWDPCGSMYPTCSPGASDDDFEGECFFHENILAQNCQDQYAWFKTALAAVPDGDWLFVVGHHPIDEISEEDFTTVLQEAPYFSMYLNGHAHLLNQYTIDGDGIYLTTGAGSMVDTDDQHDAIRDAKAEVGAEGVEAYGHTYKVAWTQTVAGFTRHTFNAAYTQLTTEFVTADGDVVHSFVSDKAGKAVTAK